MLIVQVKRKICKNFLLQNPAGVPMFHRNPCGTNYVPKNKTNEKMLRTSDFHSSVSLSAVLLALLLVVFDLIFSVFRQLIPLNTFVCHFSFNWTPQSSDISLAQDVYHWCLICIIHCQTFEGLFRDSASLNQKPSAWKLFQAFFLSFCKLNDKAKNILAKPSSPISSLF